MPLINSVHYSIFERKFIFWIYSRRKNKEKFIILKRFVFITTCIQSFYCFQYVLEYKQCTVTLTEIVQDILNNNHVLSIWLYIIVHLLSILMLINTWIWLMFVEWYTCLLLHVQDRFEIEVHNLYVMVVL